MEEDGGWMVHADGYLFEPSNSTICAVACARSFIEFMLCVFVNAEVDFAGGMYL